MKTKLILPFSLLVTTIFLHIFLSSCNNKIEADRKELKTDNELEQIPIRKGRYVFSNYASFDSLISKLDKMNPSSYTKWERKHDLKSLSSIPIDTSKAVDDFTVLEKLPRSIRMLLNSDGEVVINDSIRWWTHDGKIHSIVEKDLSQYALLKSKPDTDKDYEQFFVEKKVISTNAARTIVHSGDLDARHQLEFSLPFDPNTIARKYVHEIIDVTFPTRAALYMNIKLEWLGSDWWGDEVWKEAGERRIISYNFSASATYSGRRTEYKSFAASNVEYSEYSLCVPLFEGGFPSTSPGWFGSTPNGFWDVEISGSITQKMVDYNNTLWTNSGNPLW